MKKYRFSFLVLAMVTLLMSACADKVYSPAEIFMFNPCVRMDAEQQKALLHYAKLLKPEMVEDKLVMRELSQQEKKDVPESYLAYVSDYVDLFNEYLDKLSEMDAFMTRETYKRSYVEHAILSGYMNYDEQTHQLSLELDWPAASSVGIDSLLYFQVQDELDKGNEHLKKIMEELNSQPNSNFSFHEFDDEYLSVFMGTDICSIHNPEIGESYRKALDELNRKY